MIMYSIHTFSDDPIFSKNSRGMLDATTGAATKIRSLVLSLIHPSRIDPTVAPISKDPTRSPSSSPSNLISVLKKKGSHIPIP